jgi:hypothetical protein
MKAKLPPRIIYTGEWDFSNSADYTYDTNYISVTAGKATLLQVDQTHDSLSDFTSGSSLGTLYSGGVLTSGNSGGCNGSTTNCAELEASWTPQYSNIVAYWKFNETSWSGAANEVTDSFAGNYNGVRAGAATTTSNSKLGSYAAAFDNAGDSVILGDLSGEFATKATINVWIKRVVDVPGTVVGAYAPFYFESFGTNGWYPYTNGNIYLSTFRCASRLTLGAGIVDKTKWHMLTITSTPGVNGYNVYQNGVSIYSGTGEANICVDTFSFIGAGQNIGGVSTIDATLDDLAIWKTDLSSSEILEIYNRQAPKYSGSYSSPILNLGGAGAWTSLDWESNLPFGKELPGSAGNESALNYASFVDFSGLPGDSDLFMNLEGLWHFNEKVANGAGDDFSDSSGKGATAEGYNLTADAFGVEGLFNSAVDLDGTDDYILLNSVALGSTSTFTYSLWVKHDEASPSSGTNKMLIFGNCTLTLTNGNALSALMTNDVAWHWLNSAPVYNDWHLWHHIAATYDGSNFRLFRDGVQVALDSDESGNVNFGAGNLYVGSQSGASSFFEGKIDEVAIWKRTLDPAEILELYRRGANRVKFQVRSCDDAACDTESWIGPDGTAATYFSELHNCSSINGATGECNGSVNVASPSIAFSDFVTAPTANQYFQYQAILESDDEIGVCAGSTTCLPEVKSIEVGPTGRYFAGSPTIVNNTPVSFSSLSVFTETASGTCTPTYQISNDGATFYYWNGANWVVGVSAAQSSSAAVINANISSFTSDVAAGNLYWKTFLSSNGVQTCEIDQLEFTFQ